MSTKQCRTCHRVLALDEFYVRKSTGRHQNDCKACVQAKNRNWAEQNPDARRAIGRSYVQRHKEECAARGRANYAALMATPEGRAKRAAYSRTYAQRHPDRVKQRKAAYEAMHSDDRRLARKAWRQANREKVLAQKRLYRQRHPVFCREKNARWAASNPLLTSAHKSAHRAKKRGVAGACTSAKWRARWDYYGGRCWICGDEATGMDHVIPLAAGGPHWPANLRPACIRCNCTKRELTGIDAVMDFVRQARGRSFRLVPVWDTGDQVGGDGAS